MCVLECDTHMNPVCQLCKKKISHSPPRVLGVVARSLADCCCFVAMTSRAFRAVTLLGPLGRLCGFSVSWVLAWPRCGIFGAIASQRAFPGPVGGTLDVPGRLQGSLAAAVWAGKWCVVSSCEPCRSSAGRTLPRVLPHGWPVQALSVRLRGCIWWRPHCQRRHAAGAIVGLGSAGQSPAWGVATFRRQRL